SDVPVDLSYFSQRCRRPDYSHGGGTNLPFASLRNHCRTLLCKTPFPASISASASAIARASSASSIWSKIDFASSMVSLLCERQLTKRGSFESELRDRRNQGEAKLIAHLRAPRVSAIRAWGAIASGPAPPPPGVSMRIGSAVLRPRFKP